MMFSAVLFDLDNTLCDVVSARIRYARRASRESGTSHASRALCRVATEGCRSSSTPLRSSMTGLSECAIVSSLAIARCVQPNVIARQVVTRIGKQARIGVVTNGRIQSQRIKLSRTLGDMTVSPFVISSQVGYRKPDIHIFEHALALLNLPAHEVLFVGDDPVDDMFGASQAGMKTCWLSHGRSPDLLPCPVDRIIRTLNELLEECHA